MQSWMIRFFKSKGKVLYASKGRMRYAFCRPWIGALSVDLLLLVVCLGLGNAACAEETATKGGPQPPGGKWRILVDKVMQPEAKWTTERWMVEATAKAGFNVYCPRQGFDRPDEVRQIAQWCAELGIYYVPWMRASLEAPAGPSAEGKKVVWATGQEQPLWSPNSDELWQWFEKHVTYYAKLRKENPYVLGVFVDFENYAPGRVANLYDLSYDQMIMRQFAEERGLALPQLPPEKRKPWLQDQGLHEAFETFQAERWRARCQAIRRAVDAIEPTLRFCICPAPGTPFMIRAVYPQWATPRAPLMLGDEGTYGRPGRLLTEADALQLNRERLLRNRQIPLEAGIPFLYLGGIDPVVRGADPEFCGKNAVMISETVDGYWVFYEGPQYKVDHPEYWKWFTWANQAVEQGNFQAQHQPRQTPETLLGDLFMGLPSRLELWPLRDGPGMREYPGVNLRHENILVLAAKAGEPVKVELEWVKVGSAISRIIWEARDLRQRPLASGIGELGKPVTVEFVPPSSELIWLAVSAGSGACRVKRSSVPVGIYATNPLRTIFRVERLWFYVPTGRSRFSIRAQGSGSETVRLNVFSPESQLVATGQTSLQDATVSVAAAGPATQGAVWSLEITRADEGVLEDCALYWDSRLPPVLALRADECFAPISARQK